MPDAVQFTLDDGTVVLVAPPTRTGTGAVGLGTRLESAATSLREALAPITSAASEVIGQFRGAAQRPDEVEVTFGVVLDAKLGAVLTSASASAHLDVTLRWSGTEPTPPS
ncbi:CU044_2847 family protein [Streptomyces rishiriensis]|uniref:CU044_2847 family protein n=1 Tax=Streptomyces rishiriensis TaxID=68264 RepID=UPI000D58DDFB|nr:CU044_2847 family protein [Streptomyces rishiriensis]